MHRSGRSAPQKGLNDLTRTFEPSAAKARSQPVHDIRARRTPGEAQISKGAESGISLRLQRVCGQWGKTDDPRP